MRSRTGSALAFVCGLALGGVALAGCGGGSRARTNDAAQGEGTIRMTLSGVPTLDPARALTAQQTELDWALYLGLLTYRHASGVAGTRVIPGAAAALPRASDGGRLYTVTLRRGLRFSDGRPVRASDVVWSIERALRTDDSPVRPLLVPVVKGAAAFVSGDARSLSGVAADDARGRVTIRLRRPDAAFDTLLAQPALGIVPAGTPVRQPAGHPPPGVGPYRLRAVDAGHSFTLQRNPYWRALPGIPAGRVEVEVFLSRHVRASALAVLNGVLDVADPAQPLPPGVLAQARRLGEERTIAGGPLLAAVFLDTTVRPFDAAPAREAALAAIGGETAARAAARDLAATCDVVPVTTGSPTPVGCPAGISSRPAEGPPGGGALTGEEFAAGTLNDARVLAARSGTLGAPVVVWAPRTGPVRNWMAAEAATLRAIGYAARVRTAPDAAYRSALAALLPRVAGGRASASSGGSSSGRSGASTGSLAGRSLLARRSSKAGAATVGAAAVVGGRLARTVRVPAAGAVPIVLGPDVPLRVARRAAHRVMFAQPEVPELMSWRMDAAASVVDPVEGLDFTSLRLR